MVGMANDIAEILSDLRAASSPISRLPKKSLVRNDEIASSSRMCGTPRNDPGWLRAVIARSEHGERRGNLEFFSGLLMMRWE